MSTNGAAALSRREAARTGGAAAGASQRVHHDRPAVARFPRPERLGAHRPVAGAAHPGGVRGGVRLAGRGAPRGHRVRLGPHLTRPPRVRDRAGAGRGAGRRGLRRDHRRRAGRDGGGEPRLFGGGRVLDRARHRAAVRTGPQRLGRPRHQLPLLLRPQDDVREVLAGVRVPPGRLRHVGRAVRGAHAGADEEGHQVPRRPPRQRLLGRALRLDREDRPRRGQDRREGHGAAATSPTTSTTRCGWSTTPTGRGRTRTDDRRLRLLRVRRRHRGAARRARRRGRAPDRRARLDAGVRRREQVDDGRGRRRGARRAARTRSASSRSRWWSASGPTTRRTSCSSSTACASAKRRWRPAPTRSSRFPAGSGTCEELFEIWTSGYLRLHAKPVVLLDPDGHWTGLLAWVRDLAEQGFVGCGARCGGSSSPSGTVLEPPPLGERLRSRDGRVGRQRDPVRHPHARAGPGAGDGDRQPHTRLVLRPRRHVRRRRRDGPGRRGGGRRRRHRRHRRGEGGPRRRRRPRRGDPPRGAVRRRGARPPPRGRDQRRHVARPRSAAPPPSRAPTCSTTRGRAPIPRWARWPRSSASASSARTPAARCPAGARTGCATPTWWPT